MSENSKRETAQQHAVDPFEAGRRFEREQLRKNIQEYQEQTRSRMSVIRAAGIQDAIDHIFGR